MRTIWNGSISFGLVNIPVGLALATKPAARQSDVSFRTLHRECLTPIKQKRWCPTHEREVERDELVKGWEVSKGEFVVVEDADLEAIMEIDDSKAIAITRFVDASEVDPVYFDRTYYLAPPRETAAQRPYVLLLRAMQETGQGRPRPLRAPGLGAPVPDPPEGRRARAGDDVPRRGRQLAGRDRGGGERERPSRSRSSSSRAR